MRTIFKPEQTVLFQGDSITDCGRNFADQNSLGDGYANIVVNMFQIMFPEHKVKFINKGISGNRAIDLLERYDEDIKKINPDFISILIGINDTWRRYDSNEATSAEEYEKNYRTILEKIKMDLPHCKIMIMEPFLLNSLPDRNEWREDLDPKIQVVRKLAKKYADYYLPLDGIFAKAEVEEYCCAEMAEDGVHPSSVGHSIIARGYLEIIV